MANRDLILNNFWWKVTSLLLAVIVWFVVRSEISADVRIVPRNTYEFPDHALAILRDSTDKRPIRITPTKVNVKVSTPITEPARLKDADIQTFIDLSEVDKRTGLVRIRVYVPRGVRLEEITPTEATVEISE